MWGYSYPYFLLKIFVCVGLIKNRVLNEYQNYNGTHLPLFLYQIEGQDEIVLIQIHNIIQDVVQTEFHFHAQRIIGLGHKQY